MVLLILLALTSGVAIILGLMVMGLLEAPWPILLLLLVIGFYGLQRLTARAIAETPDLSTFQPQSSAETEPVAPSAEAEADNSSTFIYRGVKYRSSSLTAPSVDEPPKVIEGIYRGHRWRRSSADSSKPKSVSEQPTELKYRGHPVKSQRDCVEDSG